MSISAPSTIATDTANWERHVFREFVAIARFPIDPQSIESREPPEPDIRCGTYAGEVCAFELTELVNETTMLERGHQANREELISQAIDTLGPADRSVILNNFSNAILAFEFREKVKTNWIRTCLDDLSHELLSIPLGFKGELSCFKSPNLQRVLRTIDVLRGQFAGPSISVSNVGGVGDPVTSALLAKLKKNYVTDCPISLIAYLDRAGSLPSPYWQGPLNRLIAAGLLPGHFARIWIVNLATRRLELSIP